MIDEIPPVDPAVQRGFENWLEGFKPRATAAGISDATWARATQDIRYNPKVIERDRNQAEFTKTIWEYLDSAVSDTRIENGRAALAENAALLRQIEARYGVEKEVVVAVWGMESNFGKNRGSTLIIPALATLAYDGRRGNFFAQQFIAALQIIQAGDTDARHMTGSWAGAMGHTQFIPSSYLAFAVDFTGDGKRDIWSENPADALASTAAYLARSGWSKGQPWGVEVRLPQGFNYNLAGKTVKKSPDEWAALGVRSVNGGRVPNYGSASILLPAGAQGPALMIFGNFTAISRYNNANAYVIGVGHLSDRLKGHGPFVQAWPRDGRALNAAERQELQERLTARGFDTQGTDGKIGPNTISAIMAWQRANGHAPDGYASMEILLALR
ncbi:lytic murein transglycosylase [Sinirhodobacter sp. WL0062]|uniref:Lytic murein transglycosylase n=1 Tax=Rhodobacter flavimaris TaxID=2907145 RepID=A0ABS8YTS5_9RHOB|nr:lytic murein transglycosylase [Sinirhodobacter sp. WL0062]MCE5973261.1 lytic murein transglycosylase [Sinirhodobacter sp. WL0062]